MGKCIALLYLVVLMSVAAHELCHYITAKRLQLEICNVILGSRLLRIRIKKLCISPFIWNGCVEVSERSLLDSGIKGIWSFFLSGFAANFVFIIIALFLQDSILKYWILIFNIAAIVVNILPFYEDTDVIMAIQLCQKYRELHEK